ncbi:MAG: hypothetical protein ABIU07_00075, partial [Ramlibacter sp.]
GDSAARVKTLPNACFASDAVTLSIFIILDKIRIMSTNSQNRSAAAAIPSWSLFRKIVAQEGQPSYICDAA